MKLHPRPSQAPHRRPACIEPLEDRLLMTRVQGIDVSYYQGTAQGSSNHINWTSVRNAGYQFTMIRSSYGYASSDADIAYNATNALAAGMYVSFYHYAYYNSSTSNTGKAEADNFFNRTKAYLVNPAYQDHILQPMLDIEEGAGVDTSDGTLVNWIDNFTTELRAKYATLSTHLYPTPIIYMSASHATLTPSGYFENSTPAVNYPIAVAQYPSTLPDPQTGQPTSNGIWINGGTAKTTSFYQSWAFWQYTSSGVTVPGIHGNVDMDVFQGDLASLQNYVLPKTTGPVAGRFSIGSTITSAVAAVYYPTSAANTAIAGSIAAGTSLTVLAGPVYGGSFVRYQVQFTSGGSTVTGWVGDYQTVNTVSPYTVTDWLTKTVVTNVTSTTANGSYKAGAVIPITVTFNHPVDVTGSPRLTLNSGGTAVYAAGTGTTTLTFNYTVAAGNSASDLNYSSNSALLFNNGLITDPDSDIATLNLPLTTAAGSLGTNKNLLVDGIAPTVTNVTSTLANGSYPAGAVIPITLTFSEVVTVTGTPRLTLNTGALVNYSSGSGTNTLTFAYTVAAGQNAADLNYAATSALALNGGTILDPVGNNAALTLPALTATGSLATNKAIVVDTIAPTLTSVSSTAANGGYKAGSIIPITLTFSEPVLVTGTPKLTLNNGALVSYSSGSGTNTLTFNYTVAAGQDVADLDYASATALALNGGTIKDLATNVSAITLPTPGAAGSLAANKNLTIDTILPTVLSVTTPAADGTYAPGATLTFVVTCSEPVTVTGSPRLALNSGGSAVYTAGSNTTTLSFTYTVAAGQSAADLDYAATTALSLSAGTIRDPALNDANLTLPAPGAIAAGQSIVIDAVPPTATYTDHTPVARGDATLDFTVTYADALAGLDPASIGPGDLLVTGPNGFSNVAAFVSLDASTGLATYRITAPGGAWDDTDNGTYTLSQIASQVDDLAGNVRPAGAIGSFAIDLPFAFLTGTTLTVDFNTPNSPISLTASATDLTLTQGADSYTFPAASVSVITINTTPGDDTLTLTGPIAAPITLTGTGGTDQVTLTAGTTCQIQCTPGYSFTVLSGATLSLPASTQLASLTINGGTVTLPTNGTTLTTAALTITSGTLDLTTNSLVWDYTGPTPIDTLRSYLQVGRISSSAATPENHMTLGYLENANLALPAYDATALIVKYTPAGDTNLDGRINADDYALTDRGFAKAIANPHWINGDYDYSGTLDANDYLLLDASAAQAATPSPATLALREASFGPAYIEALLAPLAAPAVVAAPAIAAPETFSATPITATVAAVVAAPVPHLTLPTPKSAPVPTTLPLFIPATISSTIESNPFKKPTWNDLFI